MSGSDVEGKELGKGDNTHFGRSVDLCMGHVGMAQRAVLKVEFCDKVLGI